MSARLVHRGPDASGLWPGPGDRGDERSVALAHRRLAVIDTSDRGRQPMVHPGTGHVLVYNGEVYNYVELRAELEASGHVFATRTDTEVVLAAYVEWGRACLERLRGMFALAIWDAHRRQLFLARDRLGIKPLYISEANAAGCVLFASELRALLASGLVPRRLCPTGLATYLWNGFVVGPGTIVEGVSLLDPGSWVVVNEHGTLVERGCYWQPPRTTDAVDDPRELGQALKDAVAMRLVSDVPIGVFLSGGVDSSALTALAVAAGRGSVRTFNVAFDEAEYDESRHARDVADAVGTEHTEIRITQESFAAMLEGGLDSLDQPSFDALNSYVVSRAVREAGITVALSGAGGDELFGGYASFADVPRAARAARMARALPGPLRRALARTARALHGGSSDDVPPQTRWGKLPDLLAAEGQMLPSYQVAYALFSREFQHELLSSDHDAAPWGLPPGRLAQLEQRVAGSSARAAIGSLELALFLGERLLRDMDCASMAVSLEVRVPLIDHVVVEQLARLRESVRYRPLGRKQLLRDLALGGLDPELFERPKAGFEMPLARWMRQSLRGQLDEVLYDEDACRAVGLVPATVQRLWRSFQDGAPGLYWSRVWSLFALLRWARTNDVSLEAAS